MSNYHSFIKRLIRNYLVGSFISVLGVGSVFMVSTLGISPHDRLVLTFVLAVSLVCMLMLEFFVFLQHTKPIRSALVNPTPTYEQLKHAYIQIHRFPKLTALRILGPHFLGLAIPAILLGVLLINYEVISIPYNYILLGTIGALLVASMHAMIEYFHTTFAIEPLLKKLQQQSNLIFNKELSLDGKVLVTIKTKLQLSSLLIGAFPLLLFSLDTQVKLAKSGAALQNFWTWSGVMLSISIILSLYGAWLVYTVMMKPINELQEEMKKVQKGDFETRITDCYSDEFSRLVSGFNLMVEGLKERETLNHQLHESFFTTLAAALDARDPYTAGHSIRVAHYAAEIGKRANLTSDEVVLLRKTALLHDIGKIGIRDNVLLKDGKLTDEEFKEIKKHPVLGEDILKQIQPQETMAPFIPGVRSHHERIDGRGYPDNLAGEHIPIMGRIIAVADAFDAMTSDRPYRKGMTVQRALTILKEGRGTQWEADFVDYFEDWLLEQNYQISTEGYGDKLLKTIS